jgi:hypothetical protein
LPIPQVHKPPVSGQILVVDARSLLPAALLELEKRGG